MIKKNKGFVIISACITQVLGWNLFSTMNQGEFGGWISPGRRGGGWISPGRRGGGWISPGRRGGGWISPGRRGVGVGDAGGFVTPDFGGGGGGGGDWMTPGGGGAGGDGGWMTTGSSGGGGGGGGGFVTPDFGGGGGGGMPTPDWGDPTCEGHGGTCVAVDSSCDGEIGVFTCAEEKPVCCLPIVLPSSCGNPFLALRQRLGASRIVGGIEAQAHAWPWQVSLQENRDSFHFCGGSLISEQWVVTAAHCVEGKPTMDRVVMGEHDLTKESGRELVREAQAFIHPGFSHGMLSPNDIALLKLSSPVTINDHIFPVCLPFPGTAFDTTVDECWISGWGDTRDTGDETKLNELQVTLTDNQACADSWANNYIMDTHICVGNGSVGSCRGDSGGPLSCLRSGQMRWELAGAASWGAADCTAEGFPNVYTRVSEYMDWIISTIRMNL